MDKEALKRQIQQDYYDNHLSLGELCVKYGYKSKSYVSKYLLDGNIRSVSEANKLAHKKFPERFKHTEETKCKIREKRLRFMEEHPEQTAWRQSNLSYPERCFLEMLTESGLSEKFLIVREYSVYPYFIDFAFVDEKLAIEVDGSQHLTDERSAHDKEKDELLLSNGWKILRFTAKDVMCKDFKIISKIYEILSDSACKYERVGILKYVGKYYQKKERDENGRTIGQTINSVRQRKVKNRPTKEELSGMVNNQSFAEIGREFGVSDNTIRKWCKYYGLPFRKKDLNK